MNCTIRALGAHRIECMALALTTLTNKARRAGSGECSVGWERGKEAKVKMKVVIFHHRLFLFHLFFRFSVSWIHCCQCVCLLFK